VTRSVLDVNAKTSAMTVGINCQRQSVREARPHATRARKVIGDQMKKIPKDIKIEVCWMEAWDKKDKGKVEFDVEAMQDELRYKLIELIETHGTKECIKNCRDKVI